MNWFDSLLNIEKSDSCSIVIIITRHCNLRCSHCNVHEWLDTKTEGFVDVQKIKNFIEKLKKIGKKHFSIQFIGGEVLTVFDRLSNLIEELKDHSLTTTTNLVNLPKNHEILRHLKISVSLDGIPEDHNQIRGIGTFEKTYKNIDILIREGHEICVQSALPNEYFNQDTEKLKKFIGMLCYIGVKKENIYTGLVVPFCANSENDSYFINNLSKNAPYKLPCCAYRFMSNFIITPDGSVWNGYYNVGAKKDCLGSLDDDLDTIRDNYTQCIKNSHFGKDKNCTSCPVIKHCWGLHCFNTFKYDENLKPSSLCQKEKIIEKCHNIDVKEIYESIKSKPVKQIFGLLHDQIQ